MNTHEIQPKLCGCGCGQPAPIAKQTNTKLGHIAGQPVRFIVGHHNKVRAMQSISVRFWRKVDKQAPNGCWLWTGALDRKGYGVFGKRRKIYRTHRVAWELTNGPIPDGLHVLHNCPNGDNPRCVNPAHLWLGTHDENMRDMVTKGRHNTGERPYGEGHGKAKLTEDEVKQMRQMAKDGEPRAAIAERFHISISALYAIMQRKTWKHI